MPTTRLLPGEKRRGPTHQPSVEEAMTGRSVRSIRQRFESDPVAISSSAPATPAKKRSARNKPYAPTKTQVELAAFLRAGKDRVSNSPNSSASLLATVPARSHPTPAPARLQPASAAAAAASHVGSLIEKWSSASTPRPSIDRPPLQERHVQRVDDHDPPSAFQPHHAPAMDSVDTFGSSSVDLDRMIPKTDPGRLESYAAQARNIMQPLTPAAAALQPSSGDQSLKEIVTRGINRQTRHEPVPSLSTVRDAERNGRGEHGTVYAKEPQQQIVHLNREFKIQERIELFVQPNESHGPMSSAHPGPKDDSRVLRPSAPMIGSLANSPGSSSPGLDSNIPFDLSTEADHIQAPGNTTVIVHQVAHQTETEVPADAEQAVSDWGAGDVYIRELFSEAEETAERAVQCDENEDYFSAFELYWTVVDLYSKVIPFLNPAEGVDVHERIKMYTRRCEAIREAFEDDAEDDDLPEADDTIPVPTVERNVQPVIINADSEPPLVQTFANAMNLDPSELSTPSMRHIPNGHQRTPSPPKKASPPLDHQNERNTRPIAEANNTHIEPSTRRHDGSVGRKKPVHNDSNVNSHVELKRTPYPDHSVERPLASVPEAGDPRSRTFIANGTLSASTQAHRDSLSRPISRSAARKSTNSITRQKVAEMQERVNLMQECLNNFTVKQKHLGPARALELAVTTLNANTFGDLKKLEPLAPNLEHKWSTELEVLLSMLKEIKVVQPGKGYALRDDIAKHLPALEKCDRSVRITMRSFGALNGHVHYVDRETAAATTHAGRGQRRWWVKVPVVEDGGLKDDVLKVVQEAEMEMRSVFKICHEINVEIVKEIPIPRTFVDNLPRHARSLISRDLKEGLTTWGMFKVSDYMKDKKIWNKDSAKEIVSSLEKVSLIWEARTTPNKSFFSRTFDLRGERFHQAMTAFRRCQTAIRDLRRDWYVCCTRRLTLYQRLPIFIFRTHLKVGIY